MGATEHPPRGGRPGGFGCARSFLGSRVLRVCVTAERFIQVRAALGAGPTSAERSLNLSKLAIRIEPLGWALSPLPSARRAASRSQSQSLSEMPTAKKKATKKKKAVKKEDELPAGETSDR